MVNYAPSQPTGHRDRSRTGPWLLVAVITLAVGVAVGRWVLPAHATGSSAGHAEGAGIGAPHGPTTITQGVPSGYSHDPSGAATAAINVVQLLNNVAHGQANPATVGRTWIASNADAAVRAALSAGAEATGGDQTNKLPVSTRVTGYSETAATVQVWVVSVGSSTGIGGGTLTAAQWSTHTIGLNWEAGSWKVTSVSVSPGPQPGDNSTTAEPAPIAGGLYTFYIN